MGEKTYYDPETGKAVGDAEKAKTYFDPDTGRPAEAASPTSPDSEEQRKAFLLGDKRVGGPTEWAKAHPEVGEAIGAGTLTALGVGLAGGPVAAAGHVLRYLVPSWLGSKAGKEVGGAIGGAPGAAIGGTVGALAGGVGGPAGVASMLGKVGMREAGPIAQTVGGLMRGAAPAAEAAAAETIPAAAGPVSRAMGGSMGSASPAQMAEHIIEWRTKFGMSGPQIVASLKQTYGLATKEANEMARMVIKGLSS